jgi:hypothetical protein
LLQFDFEEIFDFDSENVKILVLFFSIFFSLFYPSKHNKVFDSATDWSVKVGEKKFVKVPHGLMTNSKLSSFVSSSFDFVAQSTSQRVCSQLCWPHVSYQTGQTESSQMFLPFGQKKKNLAMKCLEFNVCFCLFDLRFVHKALSAVLATCQLPDRPNRK